VCPRHAAIAAVATAFRMTESTLLRKGRAADHYDDGHVPFPWQDDSSEPSTISNDVRQFFKGKKKCDTVQISVVLVLTASMQAGIHFIAIGNRARCGEQGAAVHRVASHLRPAVVPDGISGCTACPWLSSSQYLPSCRPTSSPACLSGAWWSPRACPTPIWPACPRCSASTVRYLLHIPAAATSRYHPPGA
jgi:hypothetical protein